MSKCNIVVEWNAFEQSINIMSATLFDIKELRCGHGGHCLCQVARSSGKLLDIWQWWHEQHREWPYTYISYVHQKLCKLDYGIMLISVWKKSTITFSNDVSGVSVEKSYQKHFCNAGLNSNEWRGNLSLSNLLMLRQQYCGITGSMLMLLMTWSLASPCNQQLWHMRMLFYSSLRVNFNKYWLKSQSLGIIDVYDMNSSFVLTKYRIQPASWLVCFTATRSWNLPMSKWWCMSWPTLPDSVQLPVTVHRDTLWNT